MASPCPCSSVTVLATAAATAGAAAALVALYARSKQRSLRDRVEQGLGPFLESWVEAGALPGVSACVFNSTGEVWSKTHGMMDLARRKPVTEETIFRIYSMTKPVTCLCALQLLERGLIRLEDPVSRFLPYFSPKHVFVGGDAAHPVLEPLAREITVLDLMAHTSGLTYGIFGSHPTDKLTLQALGVKSLAETSSLEAKTLVQRLATAPLCFQPGTKWNYGWSTDVLGHLVEVVSGQSLDEYMRLNVFEPLEMKDTGFSVPSSQAAHFASCYQPVGGGGAVGLMDDASTSKFLVPPSLLSGGGGLVSTVADYTKFARMLLRSGELNGKRVLSADLCCKFMENHLPRNSTISAMSFDPTAFSESLGPGIGMGLGMSVVLDPGAACGGALSGRGECGWGGVASTWFFVDPEKDIGFVFMTQLFPSTTFPSLRSQLRWLVHKAVRQASL
mmetsp:Transcript_2334/g.6794  ORF Transcript_2334/g.6794 Transcript_2334/m.6794 type:complete len:446 (-) Transcript_2334:111-1448(-)|eukprot:CAMPEP_0118965122 /NCGR_PEP_ID=MMETSP1173-20130426/2719_1 /TAXON_ID=1034831 /ORGANISM="Rhizochromulina marina cf, Strain CCMP1243" /LENGTH=445 /DNA_ID=CAMNT_0006913691 /DNA_START=1 /DNA_END=1338 /DNA_ORIENTATION=+